METKIINITGTVSVNELNNFPKQINLKGIYFYKDKISYTKISYIYFLEEGTNRIFCYDMYNRWRISLNDPSFFIENEFKEIVDINIQYYKIEEYSNTIRLLPFNYCLCTINDNELIFDSWDGMTKKLFDEGIIYKSEIVEFYNTHKRGN